MLTPFIQCPAMSYLNYINSSLNLEVYTVTD